MAPRKKAGKATDGPHPATQLQGRDDEGRVRPADNRFLDEDEIAMRDEYVAEVTGDDAQQLIVKREAPEHVEELNKLPVADRRK